MILFFIWCLACFASFPSKSWKFRLRGFELLNICIIGYFGMVLLEYLSYCTILACNDVRYYMCVIVLVIFNPMSTYEPYPVYTPNCYKCRAQSLSYTTCSQWKYPRFCKCLIFSNSGFVTLSNSSGFQNWPALSASDRRGEVMMPTTINSILRLLITSTI